MSDEEIPTTESKKLLKDLGKRTACYLKVRSIQPTSSGYHMVEVVDDVGCPVGNVQSFTVERGSADGLTVLTLKLLVSGVEIIT